jgi:LysM repeat protein
MTHHSPARWLAPIALVTCAFAVYLVVSPGSDGAGSRAATTQPPRTSKGSQRPKSSTRKAKVTRTYTVQPGDTLSAIAARTGVALARIQALNPQADTQALQTGQKIKLGP